MIFIHFQLEIIFLFHDIPFLHKNNRPTFLQERPAYKNAEQNDYLPCFFIVPLYNLIYSIHHNSGFDIDIPS